jgi:hypothetical protein
VNIVLTTQETWQFLSGKTKKRVTIVSTYHKDDMRVVVICPNKTDKACGCDYNKYMLGLDLKDQMLQPYLLE